MGKAIIGKLCIGIFVFGLMLVNYAVMLFLFTRVFNPYFDKIGW